MGDARNETTLKIGELAKRFGLNVRTLRYYETRGLLPASRRTSGYRIYSEADAERLSFVLQAKRVGFSLEEIGEILRLGRHGKACGYVRGKLSEHIARVDAEIAALQNLRAELIRAQEAWDGPEGGARGTVCGLIEGWASASPVTTNKESRPMATEKRKVEVFTAGCPLCDPVVKLVQQVACSGCEVTIHDLRHNPEAAERLKAAGVERVPMVLVDGKPAGCCTSSGVVTEEGLRAAGIGAG